MKQINFLAVTAILLTVATGGVGHAASPPPVVGAKEMVVSAEARATEAGLGILAKGGNAIDAAVATAYALAVTHPCCANIGGGGFMTVHLAKEAKTLVINFRETAPLAATEDMYLDEAGNVREALLAEGYLAVGVPGTVLGLDTALQRYGTMSRADIMAPAIALAEKGYVLTQADAAILHVGTDGFASQPNIAKIFLKDGKPYEGGETLVQSDLAQSLRLIAKDGPDAFYKGPIAQAIVEASKANGGILTMEDFAKYTVEELEPVRCDYRGYEVVSTPPPSSGGVTVCLILEILEGYPLRFLGFNSAETIHYMVEAMRRAYFARNNTLGDPDFVKDPIKEMLSADFVERLRSSISGFKATDIDQISADASLDEGTNTTHFSIVDKDGNAVALTFTINDYFGAMRIAGNTGFFLNNEMSDFAAKPGTPNAFGLVQGKANAVAPGKRPLSSMSPTIVNKDGKTFMVIGTPGGSRIITMMVQGIVNVIDHGMNMAEAVNAPRIHNQGLPNVIFYEPRAFTRDTERVLGEMGYDLVEQKPWGAMEAIMKVPQGGIYTGPDIGQFSDDTTQGSYTVPGMLYGVNDARRPAGLAKGD